MECYVVNENIFLLVIYRLSGTEARAHCGIGLEHRPNAQVGQHRRWAMRSTADSDDIPINEEAEILRLEGCMQRYLSISVH